MKYPQKLPLSVIFDLLPSDVQQNSRMVCLRHGIGVAIGIGGILFSSLRDRSSPFLLEDYRLGLVTRGWFRAVINLREHTMHEGHIVFVTLGTIVEPQAVSDDFSLEGMGVSAEVFELAHGGKLPELFGGGMMDGRLEISAEHGCRFEQMLCLMRDLMQMECTSDAVVHHLVAAASNYFDQLFRDKHAAEPPSHSQEIFRSFLRLVNQHGSQQHQLQFYADRLCITPRYLGTVVQASSGVSAKEWIDRAIVAKAKVMLLHSDKQVAQIADELQFANASFFCKYFKRMVQMTPVQYRRQS